MQEELWDVREQWYSLGLQLRLRTETLDKIKSGRQFTDPRDKLVEMLKAWLTAADNPSWKTLTVAVRSVGACQLADDLESKYCPRSHSD